MDVAQSEVRRVRIAPKMEKGGVGERAYLVEPENGKYGYISSHEKSNVASDAAKIRSPDGF